MPSKPKAAGGSRMVQAMPVGDKAHLRLAAITPQRRMIRPTFAQLRQRRKVNESAGSALTTPPSWMIRPSP